MNIIQMKNKNEMIYVTYSFLLLNLYNKLYKLYKYNNQLNSLINIIMLYQKSKLFKY